MVNDQVQQLKNEIQETERDTNTVADHVKNLIKNIDTMNKKLDTNHQSLIKYLTTFGVASMAVILMTLIAKMLINISSQLGFNTLLATSIHRLCTLDANVSVWMHISGLLGLIGYIVILAIIIYGLWGIVSILTEAGTKMIKKLIGILFNKY